MSEYYDNLAYEVAQSLYAATLVGNAPPVTMWLHELMNNPREGDPVFMWLIRPGQPRIDCIGRLVVANHWEPLPDWPEDKEENPGDHHWYIETRDGRLMKWHNVKVLRLPLDSHEAKYRQFHREQYDRPELTEKQNAEVHFRGGWPATTPSGSCQVCAWESERIAWLGRARQRWEKEITAVAK